MEKDKKTQQELVMRKTLKVKAKENFKKKGMINKDKCCREREYLKWNVFIVFVNQ